MSRQNAHVRATPATSRAHIGLKTETMGCFGDLSQATGGANVAAANHEVTARHGARPAPPQISRPSTFSESDFTRSGTRWRRG